MTHSISIAISVWQIVRIALIKQFVWRVIFLIFITPIQMLARIKYY